MPRWSAAPRAGLVTGPVRGAGATVTASPFIKPATSESTSSVSAESSKVPGSLCVGTATTLPHLGHLALRAASVGGTANLIPHVQRNLTSPASARGPTGGPLALADSVERGVAPAPAAGLSTKTRRHFGQRAFRPSAAAGTLILAPHPHLTWKRSAVSLPIADTPSVHDQPTAPADTRRRAAGYEPAFAESSNSRTFVGG